MKRSYETTKLPYELTVCKVSNVSDINLDTDICFVGKTDEEISLVCRTKDTPADTAERDGGWRGLKAKNFDHAMTVLAAEGYEVVD